MNGTEKTSRTAVGAVIVRVLIVVSVLTPFVPLFIWSFARQWRFPDLLPGEWSLEPWRTVFARPAVWDALGNSLWVAVAVTAVSLLVGIPAGRAMGLYKFRGKQVVEFLILVPTIVPPLASAMGIHIMFIRYGLADTRLGVILVHLIPVTPYMVLIMSSVFANYNPDYEQQARSLGANRRQTFWHVTRPAILPGVVVGSLFAFIISWSQYILTLLIGGGRVMTLPLLLFAQANSGSTGITAALSLLFIGPAVLFLVLSARYLDGDDAALGGFGNV